MRSQLKSRVRAFLREADKNESIRRKIRIARNLIKELPPRGKELVFKSFSYNHPDIQITYLASNRSFVSTIRLHCVDEQTIRRLNDERLSRLMTLVGLSIAPHHFLIADFRAVRVACGALTEGAVAFYEDYFRAGLAEFRYRQGLNPLRKIEVIAERCAPLRDRNRASDEKILMLNGGGKDTAIMCELLKPAGVPLAWLSIEPKEQQRRIAKVSGIEDSIEVDVKIDPSIYQNPTYPWGHMPTSGMLLSVAMIPAIAKGYKYISTGNECSANEGNVDFRGMEINHQYTKSHEFESRFNDVIRSWIGTDVQSFSALRMFHDIQIAAMFEEKCSEYLGEFVSCNQGQSWCNDCEKCAFVFLSLSPFLDFSRLVTIFGEDLWEKQRTRALMLHLMTGRIKRWECVGTREECKLAASLYFERHGDRSFDQWPFMEDIRRAFATNERDESFGELLCDLNGIHNMPERIARVVEGGFRNCSSLPFRRVR